MNRKWSIGLGAAGLLAIGWSVFRPELLVVDARANEPLPTGAVATAAPEKPAAAILAEGKFHGVAHEGEGRATVHRLADGRRILRFEKFKTSNGPALHVYLVAAKDAKDNDTVTKAGFVDLGELKGNVGDQNYDIPADLDLSKYEAATVWCARFKVNFATAPLKAS